MISTYKQHRLQNAIAKELRNSGISDFALKVKPSKVAPTRLLCIEYNFHYADMEGDRPMYQLSTVSVENILSDLKIKGYSVGVISSSVFRESFYASIRLHFKDPKGNQ